MRKCNRRFSFLLSCCPLNIDGLEIIYTYITSSMCIDFCIWSIIIIKHSHNEHHKWISESRKRCSKVITIQESSRAKTIPIDSLIDTLWKFFKWTNDSQNEWATFDTLSFSYLFDTFHHRMIEVFCLIAQIFDTCPTMTG